MKQIKKHFFANWNEHAQCAVVAVKRSVTLTTAALNSGRDRQKFTHPLNWMHRAANTRSWRKNNSENPNRNRLCTFEADDWKRHNDRRRVCAIHATMNKTIIFFSIIVLWTISHNGFNCQTTTNSNRNYNRNHNNNNNPDSNRINRQRGNILRNLTRTHAYDDNIVTSQLDASERVRQFYRSIRDIYNR